MGRDRPDGVRLGRRAVHSRAPQSHLLSNGHRSSRISSLSDALGGSHGDAGSIGRCHVQHSFQTRRRPESRRRRDNEWLARSSALPCGATARKGPDHGRIRSRGTESVEIENPYRLRPAESSRVSLVDRSPARVRQIFSKLLLWARWEGRRLVHSGWVPHFLRGEHSPAHKPSASASLQAWLAEPQNFPWEQPFLGKLRRRATWSARASGPL